MQLLHVCVSIYRIILCNNLPENFVQEFKRQFCVIIYLTTLYKNLPEILSKNLILCNYLLDNFVQYFSQKFCVTIYLIIVKTLPVQNFEMHFRR